MLSWFSWAKHPNTYQWDRELTGIKNHCWLYFLRLYHDKLTLVSSVLVVEHYGLVIIIMLVFAHETSWAGPGGLEYPKRASSKSRRIIRTYFFTTPIAPYRSIGEIVTLPIPCWNYASLTTAIRWNQLPFNLQPWPLPLLFLLEFSF
jgi:hypothetical protein